MAQPPTTSNEIIQIRLFGGLEIKWGTHIFQENIGYSQQPWNLLKFLIAYRQEDVTQERLLAALWPQGDCDNPSNALKNLVYRVRTLLAAQGFPWAKQAVLYRRGTYHWNNELPSVLDVEEFEKRCIAVFDPDQSVQHRIDHALQAIEWYRGGSFCRIPISGNGQRRCATIITNVFFAASIGQWSCCLGKNVIPRCRRSVKRRISWIPGQRMFTGG